jgi:GT2 family glycosyltransferase
MRVSGYVPVYNNSATVLEAVESLLGQNLPLDEVFVVDDGSTDDGPAKLERKGIRCLRQQANLGRGAARACAMDTAEGELILCCDASNVLPPDFVQRLLPWFDDPRVAAVYGWIQDPHPKGFVSRWRARHLFKAGHKVETRHGAPLITYGTLVRRSALLEVGNFNPLLRHSEDADLGGRLLAAGYDVVSDPSVPVYCNVRNTLGQVLERYWRWYAGKDESVSLSGYWRNFVYSLKGMVWQDLRVRDPLAAMISLLCPHYQFWKSWQRRVCRVNRAS